MPIAILGAAFSSDMLMVSGAIVGGLAFVVSRISERTAFFSPTVIHHRPGIFGLSVQRIPIDEVDDVDVSHVDEQFGIADLTVRYGSQSVTFERVPNAAAKARRILQLAAAAREHRS